MANFHAPHVAMRGVVSILFIFLPLFTFCAIRHYKWLSNDKATTFNMNCVLLTFDGHLIKSMRTCGMPFCSRFCSASKFQLELNLRAVNVYLFLYIENLKKVCVYVVMYIVHAVNTCTTIFSCKISFSHIYLSQRHTCCFAIHLSTNSLFMHWFQIFQWDVFYFCWCCCRRRWLVPTKINK